MHHYLQTTSQSNVIRSAIINIIFHKIPQIPLDLLPFIQTSSILDYTFTRLDHRSKMVGKRNCFTFARTQVRPFFFSFYGGVCVAHLFLVFCAVFLFVFVLVVFVLCLVSNVANVSGFSIPDFPSMFSNVIRLNKSVCDFHNCNDIQGLLSYIVTSCAVFQSLGMAPVLRDVKNSIVKIWAMSFVSSLNNAYFTSLGLVVIFNSCWATPLYVIVISGIQNRLVIHLLSHSSDELFSVLERTD